MIKKRNRQRTLRPRNTRIEDMTVVFKAETRNQIEPSQNDKRSFKRCQTLEKQESAGFKKGA